MATLLPRCPHCNARGLDYLVIEQIKQFNLVYCGVCGAIHGVLPSLTIESSLPTQPKSNALQPQLEPAPGPAKNGKAPTPPTCRQHHVAMEQRTVPPGQPDAGQRIWICPRFKECHQWEKAEEALASLPAISEK